MTRKFWMSAIFAAALAAPAVFAQTAPAPAPAPAAQKKGRIAARKTEQQKRVAQGVQSGQLNVRETGRIEHNEAKINREVRRDRVQNGGNLTNKEKAQVNRQQNRVSREIYHEKHDAQTQQK